MEWWFAHHGNRQQPELVADERGTRIPGYTVQASTCNLTLVIPSVEFAQHEGNFICRVQSSGITVEESAVLTVLRKIK